MSFTTIQSLADARDQTMTLVNNVISSTSTMNGAGSTTNFQPITTIWDDVQKQQPTQQVNANNPVVLPWLRVGMKHNTGGQASLAGQTGLRRYTKHGLLIIEVFGAAGNGQQFTDPMADSLLAGIQGKSTPGNIWFRNGTVREVGVDGAWWKTNVILEFEYDQFG
jgi:hypothetical protein